MHLLNGRFLILLKEESGMRPVYTSSGPFHRVGMTRMMYYLKGGGPWPPTAYTSQDAQRLDFLWWEWPPEHLESLRFVASTNFMETPKPGFVENGKMTDSQLQIVVAFVTELISFRFLDLVPRGILLFNACPIFLVAKPGQPGQPDQWGCIADMKKGRQNQSCAAYPVHMDCPEDIRPSM
jgi:hypothetical protein